MENKETAIDYIVNIVNSCIAPDYIPNEIVKQAKQMEKEQIMKAYLFPNTMLSQTPQDYYNKTYGE